MKRYAPLLLALIFASSLSAQDQDARVVTRIVTDTVPAWKTWKGDLGSMNYPGTWQVNTEVAGDTVVLFRNAASDKPATAPLVVLIVLDQDDPAASDKLSPPSGEDVTVIATDGPDNTGSYSMEYQGQIDGRMQHRLEHVTYHDGRSYILTYTASPEAYGEQLFLAEAMMKSFALPVKK